MEPDLEKVICEDHAHCATCGQYLLGWECWRDPAGTYWCSADCWLDHPLSEDPDKK